MLPAKFKTQIYMSALIWSALSLKRKVRVSHFINDSF